jgi:hypothetical protein
MTTKRKKADKETLKLSLDQLINQTKPILNSMAIKGIKIAPELMDLGRLSRLEDLDRLWRRIQEVQNSPQGVNNLGHYRRITEEQFQWFVDMLTEKYHAEEAKVDHDYPVKRKR